MKKCILYVAALCLLLMGCAAPAENAAPDLPPTYYAPYYADPAVEGFQADVVCSSDAHTRLGRLNNRYLDWAQGVYRTLGVANLMVVQMTAPDLPYVKVSFSSAEDEVVEIFTLYENDFVLAEHPTEGVRQCVAPAGCYKATVTYLESVTNEQRRYFSLWDEHTDKTGHHPAAYALYDAEGETVVSKEAPAATVEMWGEGIVCVTDVDGSYLYAPHEGKQMTLPDGRFAFYGDYLAVADSEGVAVYPLFATQALCRIYVAADATVTALDFTADGESLHIAVCNADGSLYDRTLPLSEEINGSVCRLLGDWRSALTPATEKEEQVTGYAIIKKLRHREKALGYYFSGILTGHLSVEGTDYILCEIGHWITDEDGSAKQYEIESYLLVPTDLSAGYAVELDDNELCWDTEDDWFEQ